MTSPPARARPAAADADALAAVAAAVLPDVVAISDEVTAAILGRQPDLVRPGDPAARAAVERATLANVRAIITTLAAGIPPATLDVPDGALDVMDHVAVEDDALPAMLRAYRVGAAALTRIWLEHLVAEAADVAQYGRLAATSSEHVAAYVDRISDVITDRWTSIADAAVRSGRRREALLHALLDGRPADGELSELGHPVDGGQLVVASLAPPGGAPWDPVGDGAPGTAPRITLARSAGVTLTLVAVPHPVARTVVDRVVGGVPAGVGCVVAVAPPGIDALVAVAGDAVRALHVVGRVDPGRAVAHADVVVLCSLLEDEPRAVRLVQSVLGPLAAAGARPERLRATLRAYFAAGERKTGAAALLGVHEKTVGHRMAQIESELGHRIDGRRSDLATALRLERALARRGSQAADG